MNLVSVSVRCLSIGVMLVASSDSAMPQQLRDRPPIMRGGLSAQLSGGVVGGQEFDEKQSVWTRADSFDYEYTYANLLRTYQSNSEQYFGKLREELTAEENKALAAAIEKRMEMRGTNLKYFDPMLAFSRLKRLEASGESEASKAVFKKLFNLAESPIEPTIAEQNSALIEYKREELKAEQQFSDEVLEILRPQSREKFLRALAKRGHQFIVHPLGIEYLDVKDSQTQRIRKHVQIEIASRADTFRKVLLKQPDLIRSNAEGFEKAIPVEVLEKLWRAQFTTLAQLDAT